MSSDSQMNRDRNRPMYKTPKLTAEELEDWREDFRLIEIITQLRRYLSQNEYSPNKWDPLLNSETKPETLRVSDSDWEEAQRIAHRIKRREDEETYEDDFEEASSSSSSTSCQSSSSVEYGELRITSSFSAKLDQRTVCVQKERQGKQPKRVSFNSDVIQVKDFYVSQRERRMKSEACPLEMVRRNEEEVRLEFILSQIKMDETDDLDRLVFRKLKFKTVHMLEHGERGCNDESSCEKIKAKKVPTYADFLKKSKCERSENVDAILVDGQQSKPDHKTKVCEKSVKVDKALLTGANETKTTASVKEVEDTQTPTLDTGTEDEIIDVSPHTVSEEPLTIGIQQRAESSASQSSSDHETPEMTNEEIIAKLEETETLKRTRLQRKSHSIDSFKEEANSKRREIIAKSEGKKATRKHLQATAYSAHSFKEPEKPKYEGVKLQSRNVRSTGHSRLNTVNEVDTKYPDQTPVQRSQITGDVRRSVPPTTAYSDGIVSTTVTSKQKNAGFKRSLSQKLVPQSLKKQTPRLNQDYSNIKIHTDCDIKPRGSCRLIVVKPAPGAVFDYSSGEEIEEDATNYDTGTDSHKTDVSSENGKPSQLSNGLVQQPTAQGQRPNNSRPKWRRRVAEVILGKLRRFGDQLKCLNCARCL